MIKVCNKIKRNLEEQVQYLTNYHDVNQGLVQWGIRVVGQVETTDELPLPYDGEYGDAIAVGTEAPFFFYIWTRASIEGEPAYWFPFGEISIVGPEGPRGEKGDKGNTGESTKWYTGSDYPLTANIGDMYLNNSGEVFYFGENGWEDVTSIRGPQGIQGIRGPQGQQGVQGEQGPKGDTGDVGGFINIFGILDNEEQLPLPSTLNNLTASYLVGENKDLYIQVGETSEEATWNNVGPFNAATLVMVNGIAQNVWDADTKLDKITAKGQSRLYSVSRQGEQGYKQVFDTPDLGNMRDTIPMYYDKTSNQNYGNKLVDSKGVLLTNEPNQPYQAANKKYVDENFVHNAPSMADPSGRKVAYCADKDGNIQYIPVGSGAGCIPLTNAYGLLVGSWEVFESSGADNTYTPKKYVQEHFLEKDTSTTDYNQVYVKAADGSQGSINVSKQTVADCVVQRKGDGNISVPQAPTSNLDAASKYYVDNVNKLYRHEIVGYMTNTNGQSKSIRFNVYNHYSNKLITPQTTSSVFATIASKYLQPATSILVRSTSSPATSEAGMIKTISSTSFELVSGTVYNFSTAQTFNDNITEM